MSITKESILATEHSAGIFYKRPRKYHDEFRTKFLGGKGSANINAGLQRDDLRNTKQSNMRRLLLNFTANARPSEKFNIGLNYSNLQAYTFLQTGFEAINQVSPYENLDTLNFTQLSQNAGLNINYALEQSKSRSQQLFVVLNFMETANRKADIIRKGEATRFVNGSLNYTLSFPSNGLNISSGINYSYNYATLLSGNTWGPMINISKSLLKNVLRTNYGVGYNTSKNGETKVTVVNARANATANFAKRHNLNFSAVWQQKKTIKQAAAPTLRQLQGIAILYQNEFITVTKL
ncbi:hypothetical protein [Niabella ginsengisoli]|uniref:TonB-dependent receptor n=1 Tax=Niabella ginsengisoli TaxID=522298 RepID=A0ABS9SHZ1_9BACT|nr:hypothetical protein [Niabella ginsengisoli]MCH5597984.1 hypothetical protein [Niabella ginsengisoli]